MSHGGHATGAAAETHPPQLAHHFESLEQQYESSKLGMWIFLATEVLLFAGLFCAYAVYRANHPEIFVYAHQFLNKYLGAVNTVVLLCSSFTMAWAVRCAQLGKHRATAVLLALTFLGGVGFMGIKYIEYEEKWEHGLLWGSAFSADLSESHDGEDHGGTSASQHPTPVPRNVHLFFSVYFLMTGLHGLHVLAGMALIAWVAVRAARGEFGPDYYTPVDLVGLYWHLVDLIWIYLFPLLYLIH